MKSESTQQGMAADEAMNKLWDQQEPEAQIVVTTSDAGRKPKPAITSLTINWATVFT